MDLHELYNPKRVYEGFFETYFIRPFVHQYFDFTSKESPKTCFMSLLAWIVITLGVIGIMMGQIGLIGPQGGLQATWWVCGIWFALSLIPVLAMFIRTANGSPKEEVKPRLLGIDTLLGVSCLLFFLLGLLMMSTTMHSEVLNPNGRIYDESDTVPEEIDYIEEEPIFTYQDEKSPVEEGKTQAAPAVDSLSQFNEPDIIEEVEETFDPTIQPPAVDTL